LTEALTGPDLCLKNAAENKGRLGKCEIGLNLERISQQSNAYKQEVDEIVKALSSLIATHDYGHPGRADRWSRRGDVFADL